MKNPILYIKQAIYTALNVASVTTVSGQSVTVFTDAPKEPPTNFIWGGTLGYVDLGTKNSYVGSVDYEVTIVTKTNVAQPDSTLLEEITNEALQVLVSRGIGLPEATGNFEIYSVIVNDISNDSTLIDNKLEIYNKINLTLLCNEL